MSFREATRTILNEKGTYCHAERQILIAFIGIGIAIYPPNHHLGVWHALLITSSGKALSLVPSWLYFPRFGGSTV